VRNLSRDERLCIGLMFLRVLVPAYLGCLGQRPMKRLLLCFYFILAALLCWLQSLEHPIYVMTTDDDMHYIYADGVQICSTTTLEKAVVLFIAVYYVFHMVICKHAMKTVTFLLKFGCHIDSDVHDAYARRASKQCIALFEKISAKQTNKRNDDDVFGTAENMVEPPVKMRKRKGKRQCTGGKDNRYEPAEKARTNKSDVRCKFPKQRGKSSDFHYY